LTATTTYTSPIAAWSLEQRVAVLQLLRWRRAAMAMVAPGSARDRQEYLRLGEIVAAEERDLSQRMSDLWPAAFP